MIVAVHCVPKGHIVDVGVVALEDGTILFQAAATLSMPGTPDGALSVPNEPLAMGLIYGLAAMEDRKIYAWNRKAADWIIQVADRFGKWNAAVIEVARNDWTTPEAMCLALGIRETASGAVATARMVAKIAQKEQI